MNPESSQQAASSSSIILPVTEYPYEDCIHFDTFKKLGLSLKREYAEYFDLASAEILTDTEICEAFAGNEWIPAIDDHVWIPAPNLKGMTVSRDIEDLELWRDTQLTIELKEGDQCSNATRIYDELRQRWENALLKIEEYIKPLNPRPNRYIHNEQDVSFDELTPAQQKLYMAQYHLSMARFQILQNQAYYMKRRLPLVVDGVVFGDATRLTTPKPRSSIPKQGPNTPIIIIPSDSSSDMEVEELHPLIPSPDRAATRAMSPQNLSESKHGKASTPQECTVDETLDLRDRSEPSLSGPLVNSTDTPAHIVVEGGIDISESIPSFVQSPIAFGGSDELQTARHPVADSSMAMDVTVHNLESALVCTVTKSKAAEVPSLSLKPPYIELGLKRPLSRQYAMSDVLEGERATSNDQWTVVQFIEGLQSFIGEASQAVRNQTQLVFSSLRSVFGVTKSPLKRSLEEDGQEPNGSDILLLEADEEPSTPRRKKARRGESPYETSNSIVSERLPILLADDVGIPASADSSISNTGLSSWGTAREENVANSNNIVRRLSGVLRNSGSKYQDQTIRASPRRSTRIAKSSPR